MSVSRVFTIDEGSLPKRASGNAWSGRARTSIRCCGVMALLGLIGSQAPAAAADQDFAPVGRGAYLAQTVCSNCHVVADDQRSPPRLAQRPPSFREIANRPGTNLKALRRFIATTHWDEKTLPATMPNLMLTKEDVAAVSRYIMSLRLQPPH